MRKLHIDVETYSAFSIKFGEYKYTSCPDFRILLFAYAFDDKDVQVIDLEHGEELPIEVVTALCDANVSKYSHNAPFEVACLNRHLNTKLDVTQWRCSAVMCRSVGLASSLAEASKILELDMAKQTVGKRLIKRFCVPGGEEKCPAKYDYAEDWELFKEYCKRDVEAEQEICKKLKKYPMADKEWEVWCLDQKINGRGLPIDRDLVESVREVTAVNSKMLMQEARELTGIDNPNSGTQLKKWLLEQGTEVENLQAETVSKLLCDDSVTGDVSKMLQIKQQLAKASLKKFDAAANAIEDDDRVRGTFKFYGAEQTGRWSGKGFQPQNLARPTLSNVEIDHARKIMRDRDADLMGMLYSNVSDVSSSLLRSVISAPDGYKLVVADLASIESVMGAYGAGSEYLLNLFREGRDSYKDFATKMYGVEYEGVTKEQRTRSKPCVLGAGYGLSGRGLQAYAEGFGMKMSVDEANDQIQVFRETYPDIPRVWGELTRGAFEARKSKGKRIEAGKFWFGFNGMYLVMGLPSGRRLYYRQPLKELNDWGRDQLTYMKRGQFRVGTHGGKIYENAIQAISRDVLVHGMLKVDSVGLTIIGHVHDEIICLEEEDRAGEALKTLIDCMTDTPDWLKGEDVPLRAEGYIADYYRK